MEQKKTDEKNEENLREYFHEQVGPAKWSELDKLFAQGLVLEVAPALNLIDTAIAISLNDKKTVQRWIDDQLLSGVSDERAKVWFEEDIDVFAVVVEPWVLVKKRENR
ncbi:MAG: DUF2288 family protein [Leptospirales bacterium]